VLTAALVDGERETLLLTAIQLARAGNVPMLKFLLSHTMPRDRQALNEFPENCGCLCVKEIYSDRIL
jgi:hypothetical protein